MNHDDARDFATRWIAAWNAHDINSVLDLFAEHAVFCSPLAADLIPDSRGRLEGKSAIREYWTLGLQRIPDLRFELVETFVGVRTIVLTYRNHTGARVNEVLQIGDDGLVEYGEGTYLAADPATASGARQASDRSTKEKPSGMGATGADTQSE